MWKLQCAKCCAYEGSGQFARLDPIGDGETKAVCLDCLKVEYVPLSQPKVAEAVGEQIGNPEDQFWEDRRTNEVYLQSDDGASRKMDLN